MVNHVIPINLGMVKAFLIKGEKYILVDTGMPQSFEKIKKFLEENQIDPKDISLIVLTHSHTDHAGSLKQMQALTGAKVLIHKTESGFLEQGLSTPVQPRIFLAKIITKLMKRPKLEGVKADLILEKELELSEFGVNCTAVHTPGHTPGSLSVLLENGESVVGDIITGKNNIAKYPFIWVDINEIRDSLKMLLEKGTKLFYNAHGDVCDDEAVRKLLEEEFF